VDLRKIHPL